MQASAGLFVKPFITLFSVALRISSGGFCLARKLVTLTKVGWIFKMKSIEERNSILEKDIFKHVNHGWRVTTKSETKAILERYKKVNGSVLIKLLLLFIVPGIIYLLMPKGRSRLLIEVTQEGNIHYNAKGLSDREKSELMRY